MTDRHFLELLAKEYPTIRAASSEIINLKAILSLPKGTEYFFSDLHGEHEAFIHLLKSASGVIRSKIDELFEKSVSDSDRALLANLIYYPERILTDVKKAEPDFEGWCKIAIYRLSEVCRAVSSKYTRSKVRKALPEGFSYIMDELLHAESGDNKAHYYSEIHNAIVETGMAEEFIVSMCNLIQRLTIDRLHIIGDIFDRGPHPDAILDALMNARDVDIQWGNHDISWMGAAAGNWALIANVIRLGISYNSFDLLEDGYGINLRALAVFASDVYKDDPCAIFTPHILDENKYDPVDIRLAAKMHKAIAVIQFKVEGQLIRRHPEYHMDDRILLDKINFEEGTVRIGEGEYPLRDPLFVTVDPKDPLALTEGEQKLMQVIALSFQHSERLQKHIRFLYAQGGMYKGVNSNLLYHGCIPMTEDGEFETVNLFAMNLSGKAYLDYVDSMVRHAYFSGEKALEHDNARDFLWYLWCGPKSPLYGKSRMTAFERYFIEDKDTYQEEMDPYYSLIENPEICEKILREFGLDPQSSHIVNGHVPVRINESPVKAGGLLFVIDGGISKAYQSVTGIGGYTLIYNSRSLAIAEHKPFDPTAKLSLTAQSAPRVTVVEAIRKRVTVEDTDIGGTLKESIEELKALLSAYRSGVIKERIGK